MSRQGNVIVKEKRLCIKCGVLKKWDEFKLNGVNRTPKRVCLTCKTTGVGVLSNLDSYEIKCYEKYLIETGLPPFDHSLVDHSVNQVCLKCGHIKLLNEFRLRPGKNGKPRYRTHQCKVCEAYYTSEWRNKNPERAKEYRDYYHESGKSRENYINLAHRNLQSHLYYRAKNNAKVRGVEFNLTIDDIVVPEKCKYLDIALSNNVGKSCNGLKDSYSVDRIDPKKGYVKGNVQIISKLANTMKNEASIEELITFSKNVLRIHDNNNKDEDIV